MLPYLKGVWENAPIWVWSLLVVLIVIGVMASRDRRSSAIPYFFLPLLGLLSLGSIRDLGFMPFNWVSFALFYTLGAIWGHWLQDRLVLGKNGMRLNLAGEWWTLLVLMLIYFSNFMRGMMSVVSPETLDSLIYTLVFAAVIGAASGSFLGRGLAILRMGRR